MSGERTYPILVCPELDPAIAFYEVLGFRRTYRQVRPNPYAVVALEDIAIHLAGVAGFDPATSVGSVIVVVPDADALYAGFADGLRQHYGRLPSTGCPRILRPRRKQGTATGFSIVDTGGNWLRFYRAGETEDADPERGSGGLARAVEVAARQGDARGDDAKALAVLERGLARHPDAPPLERARALLYQCELLVRLGQPDRAAASIALATAVVLPDGDAAAMTPDLAHAREVLATAGHVLPVTGDPG